MCTFKNHARSWVAVAVAVGTALVCPFVSSSDVYKCEKDGALVYQDKPCDGGSKLNIAPEQAKPPPHRLSEPVRPAITDVPDMKMTVQDVLNAMFRAATRFATEKTSAWNHNMLLYLKWRVGEAEVVADCFFGEGGVCLGNDIKDKQFVERLFSQIRTEESQDLDLQQLLKEDPSAVSYARYFAKRILGPNIYSAYRGSEAALRKDRPDHSDPPPVLILYTLAAAGRYAGETQKLDIQGWTADDCLGWALIHYSGSKPDNVVNVAALMADAEIPFKEMSKTP